MAKKVRFNPKSTTEDPVLIVAKFRWNANEVVLSTGFSVGQKNWDKEAQRVKSSEPRHNQFNAIISRMEKTILDEYWALRAVGINPTREDFKQRLLEKLKRKAKKNEDVKPVTLIEFINLFIEEKKGINAPAGTLKTYTTALNHLKAYGKARSKKIDFDTISPTFKHDFIAYLFSKNLSTNYTSKNLATLVAFLNEAAKRGHCDFDNRKIGLSLPEKEVDTVYLSEKELQILFNLQLDSRLDRVRNLFLLGCLTGLRFGDYSQIKPENVRTIEHDGKEVLCLVVTPQKTQKRVTVPLINPMLKAILEKYGMSAPKAMSNQKFNKYLKELSEIANFDTPIEVNEYQGGRHKKITKAKKELISSHTARRSFATNALKAGIDPMQIMQFTGHKTVASFMKYIRTTGEETAVLLSDHSFFTGKAKVGG